MTRLTQTLLRRSSRLLLFLLAVIAWQTSWADATWTWTANNAASATDATDAMKSVVVSNYGTVSFAFAVGSKTDVFSSASYVKFSGAAVKITITLPEGKTFNAGDRFTIKIKGGKSGLPGWLIVGEDGKTDLIPDKTTDETKSQAEYTSTVKLSSSFTSSNTIVLRPAASGDKYTDGTTTGGGSFYLSSIEYTQASSVVDPFSTDPATTTAFGYASKYGSSGVTGGGTATPTPVTTAAELKTAMESDAAAVVLVKNDITVDAPINLKGIHDKTLLGMPGVKLINNNPTATITGSTDAETKSLQEAAVASTGIIVISGTSSGSNYTTSSNIIIRNLTFVGSGAYDINGNDLLSIEGAEGVWVDHCDFQDGVDDCLDFKTTYTDNTYSTVKYNTDDITVSWCRFHYLKDAKTNGYGGTAEHKYANLVGNNPNSKPSDGIYNLTWAYNWWDEGCIERQVRSRNAAMHYINDVWSSSVAHYFAGPEKTSSVFSGCYFGTTTNHITSNYIWHPYEQTTETDNPVKFEDCTSTDATYGATYMANIGTPTDPSYAYSYDTAADAYSKVTNTTTGAGATLNVDEQGNISIGGGSTSIDYAIDFTKTWASSLSTGGNASKCWVTSITDGVPTYETSAPQSYKMYFEGYYKDAIYGLYYKPKFQIPVKAGYYKVSLGCSDYGGALDITDGTTKIGSINNKGSKYASDKTAIASTTVQLTADGTITIATTSTNIYFPYIRVESTDAPAATYTITYHNNNHGTAPDNVTSATALPNPLPTMSEEGYTFNGWFTDEALQTAAVAGATLTANADLYAKWTEFVEPTSLDFTIDFRSNPYTLSGDYKSGTTVGGTYHDGQHGYNSATVTIPVPGNVMIKIGKCYYNGSGATATVKNGSTIVATPNVYVASCDGTTSFNNYATIYYLGDATTLTFTGSTYTPYLIVKSVTTEEIPTKENGYYQVQAGSATNLLACLDAAAEDADCKKIYVPNGTYDLGTSHINISTDNIAIIGESMNGVIIKNTPAEEGLKVAYCIHNSSTGLYMQNITLQSLAPWKWSDQANRKGAERAHALFDEGTKTICKNVYLKGTQDTYLSNKKDMVAYFEGGKIEGTVDFICGAGKVFYEGIQIYCTNSSTYMGGEGKTTSDVVIAPQPFDNSSASSTVYGYVFNNCTLNGTSTQAGTITLGRGWGQTTESATVDEWIYSLFANTTKKINYQTQKGSDMNGSLLTITEQSGALTYSDFFGENKSFGNWDPKSIISSYTTGEGAKVPTESITMNDNGVISYVTNNALNFSNVSGLTAYIATNVTAKTGSETGYITLAKAGVVPVGEAIVLKGTANTTYAVPSATSATAIYNLFKASDGLYTVADGDYTYAMNLSGQFQKIASGVTIPEGKAYIKATSALSAKTLTLKFDDGSATTINTVDADANATGTKKAFVNGKFVIIKNGKTYNAAGTQIK